MKKLIQKLINYFLIQGFILAAFGVLIIIYPNILNYLIAGFLIIAGINSFYFAYKIRIYILKTKNFILKLKN